MVNIGVIEEAGHMTCPYCEQVVGVPHLSSEPQVTAPELDALEAGAVALVNASFAPARNADYGPKCELRAATLRDLALRLTTK